MNGKDSKESRRAYFYRGLTIFLVVAACVVFFFLIYKLNSVVKAILKILNILQPLIIGLAIAYIINPMCDFFRRHLQSFMEKRIKKLKRIPKTANVVAVFAAVICFVLILGAFLWLVIPQFITSISNLVSALPRQLEHLMDKYTAFARSDSKISNGVVALIRYGEKWLETDLTPDITRFAGYFATGILGVINFTKNFAIGLIFTVYLLLNKELFQRQTRKLMYALFPQSFVGQTLRIARQANTVFSGYIIGVLLDSAAVGVLCFLGCTVLRVPYAMLIAVIIGFTNIIPVLGPYLGSIPSSLFVLLSSPIKGLYFIIFIICLQMFDANILAPRIIGNKTGLGTFWVVFAIVFGGGLFGIPGMVIGVPAFAIMYSLITAALNAKLKKKQLPIDSAFYDSNVLERLEKGGLSAAINLEKENETDADGRPVSAGADRAGATDAGTGGK